MLRLMFGVTLAGLALPAMAQQVTVDYAYMQSRYPRMNEVHLRKCDSNGDGQYTKAEQLCVAGIYQQMYRAN